MFTPKYPTPDTPPTPAPTAPSAGAPVPVAQTPAPLTAVSNRPTVQLTPGSTVALAVAGGGVVLVVGAVLVSLLLAVAITGMSVAVCAVVLRSILNQERKH